MRESPARLRLLKTASKLFIERGYSNVGVDEIICKSEVAKATFYSHFPSKEALVEAWLQSVHDASEENQNRILSSPGCPIDKVSETFENLAKYLVKHEFRGCPYSNSCAVSDGSTGILKQIELHKESMRHFYRALCSKFVSEPESINFLADQIFILFSGATTEAQNLRAIWPVCTARNTALTLCRLQEGN